MLQELIQYAERNGLAGAGYSTKTVKWAIQADLDGRCLGIAELGNPDQKRNRGREFNYCPDTPGMQSGGKSHFLVESLETVLLFGKNAQRRSAVDKHGFFVGLLRKAAAVVPEFALFADILDDAGQRARLCEQAEAQKAKPSDKITLMVVDRDEPLLVEDPAWRPWWDDYRRSLLEQASGGKHAEGGRMRCFATGELIKPADTHPKITQLAGVGASSMGASLVSFDKDAFASLGLSQSAGAAMSEDAAAAYRAAIEDILAHHGYNLAGARVGYWYDKTVPPEDDPLSFLVDPGDSEEQGALARARELLDAVRTGKHPEADKYARTHYYAMTLSGNGGRVVVRDWMTGTFDELLASVVQWFEDLSIISRDGSHVVESHKLGAVLAAPLRELKDVPGPLSAAMWRCAVKQAPIPTQVMAKTLARVKVDLIQDEPARHARLGLLKAYCNRNEGVPNMNAELNAYETDAAYLCGRIMAILAKIQQRAMPEVGVGVVQRYYAAASATPGLILGRLVRTAQIAHLPKIGSPGLRHWFESQLGDVWNQLQQAPPSYLTLEQQTLFAMGYYHQNAKRAQKAAESDPNGELAEEATS